MFNCVDMDWTDDKIEYGKCQIVKFLFNGKFEMTHCEIINDPDSVSIDLKFRKKL